MSTSCLKLLLVFFCFFSVKLESFEKVVIWGHKNSSHTHYYIHNAFFKTFNYLGYSTYWFDDFEEVSQFDFSNSLFLTEGQVDKKIPILDDCRYILHNCMSPKYQILKKSHWISLQVYTDDVLSLPNAVQIAPCIYSEINGRIIFMPWATDLLPHEIDQIQLNLPNQIAKDKIYWMGTIGEGTFGNKQQVDPFVAACIENDIQFIHLGPGLTTLDENIDLVQKSYIAPTIVGEWQNRVGYIPCRIFKNISYGAMGVTNSLRVSELFEGKIIFDPDPYQLFYQAKQKLDLGVSEELLDLMNFVKEKHTYLNRIEVLLNFLEEVEKQYEETN